MRSGSGGFTLLETMIAVVLFTVGIVTTMQMFSAATINSTDAENTAIAMDLAAGRLEEIRNISFESVADEAKADVSGFSGFQRQVAVTEPLADLKQVTVTVYWTFKSGEVSVPLSTYISKY